MTPEEFVEKYGDITLKAMETRRETHDRFYGGLEAFMLGSAPSSAKDAVNGFHPEGLIYEAYTALTAMLRGDEEPDL
ncbi:hypothetical protein [Nocardia sp. NPDC051570]|uniref:hypothetical protein n=1 Tax=Nocardia sp. NPDC051570 TaxID=3364324 RepID=UPI0037B7E023